MDTRAARPSVVSTAAGIVVLAALLTGCSPDASVEEFCDTSGVPAGGDGSDSENLTEVITALSDIEAPDEIADDWETYLTGMTAFAEAVEGVEGVDPPSPESDDAYVAARTEMLSAEFTEATERLTAFVEENCDA